jgi:hypothetical protein
MDFLSVALQCSFLPVTVGASPSATFEAPGYVLQAGSGDPAKSGDLVTVDYCIQDESGKEIANSERRGIPYTFELFATPGDLLLNGATLGARSGEERLLVFLAEEWHPEVGPFNLVRNPGPLLVRIRVARVDRR